MNLAWIVVSDIKKAVEYYTKTVGLTLYNVSEEYGWAELGGEEGGAMLGIAQYQADCPIPKGSNAILTFKVSNIMNSIEEFSKKGAKLIGEVMEVPGHVKLQLLVDEDGNHYQLVEELVTSCCSCSCN